MTGWSTSCVDWERRIVAGESLVTCPPMFPDVAARAYKIFSRLRVADAIGCPPVGKSITQNDKDFVNLLFGSLDLSTGRRLIQEYFYLLAKKNGKSTHAAAIMLTALILNWRNSADFFILAPTVDVADNNYIPLREMIKADPVICNLLKIQNHIRTITHLKTGARLRVVAATAESVAGKKGTGILIDELWLFGKRANSEDMIREAIGGLASRPEGFVIYLSSQSEEPPAGAFRSRLDYARGVRDGRIDDNSFLPIIYEFPRDVVEKREYLDPKNFYITNPYVGISVDQRFLERELFKAQKEDGDMLNGFLSKHLSVEVSTRLRSDRWAGADLWDGCTDESLTLDSIVESSDILTCGIDGGGLDDLYALAVMGRDKDSGVWRVWVRAWVNANVLEIRLKISGMLKDFHEDKLLNIVESKGDDIRQAVDIVEAVYDSGKLFQVGVDPYGIAQTVEEIQSRGIPEDMIVGIAQGWKLISTIKGIERRLSEKKFFHEESAMLNWAVGNARTKAVGNAVSITKQESLNAKIDPLIAIFNAGACMAAAGSAVSPIAVYLPGQQQ